MVRKKVKKGVREPIHRHEHHYYGPDWGKMIVRVVAGIMCLVFLITFVSFVVDKSNERKIVHSNCLSACKYKGFMGSNLGVDIDGKCFINEVDRTDCIKECNSLYLRLPG